MAAVKYTQVPSLPLYASNASGDAGVSGYWSGYLPSTGAQLGATATLLQTWNDIGGTYLFLAAAPDDFTAFYDALAAWLPQFAPAGPPRFLWLDLGSAASPSAYWKAVGWFAKGVASNGNAAWTTVGAAGFRLGIYRLQIAAGKSITLDQTEPASAVFEAGAATFYGPGAAFAPTAGTAIPFQGSTIGTWTGQLPVPADGLPSLGVELRYAVRNSVDPNDPRLIAVSMPVLGSAAAAMTLSASWDPLYPMRRGRTGFAFASSRPAIASYFVTQRGYATTLTPTAASTPLWAGGLMFGSCATRIDPSADPALALYDLVPDGAFSLAVVPPQGGVGPGLTDELMLGLSGLETAQISAGSTVLLFQAGQAAFAPSAAPDSTVPGDGTTLLTTLATTAWVSPVPSSAGTSGLLYYAQPRQSPLFTGAGSAVMNFQEVPAARLAGYQTGDQSPPAPFPVGVYSGVAATSAAAARALELAALAPRRRQLITGSMPGGLKAQDDADVIAVTPQGLAVTLASDLSEIDGVIIANLPPDQQLKFDDIGTDFEAAMFANQRFFVVSNPTTFLEQAGCVAPFALNLDGWTFNLDPAHWRTGDASTLMVWKFANRPLEALAADTAGWAWQAAAEDNTGSITQTWKQLNAILLQARNADPESPYGRFHREVVADPAWNGVLFLNAPVDLASLPDALRFVSAGLDPARFYAHHIGASVTPFDPTTVPLTLKTTSVFGLIDYNDTVDLVPEETVPFAFKTMQLTARFANAHLADFAAQVEISLNRVLGSPLLKQTPERGNNLLLSGALQKSAGAPSYSFSLVGENKYTALNAALTGVEITSVRIETLANPAPDRVTTNFALGGNLRFQAPPDFDPFSYGPAPATDQNPQPFDGYLTFGQLVLTMDFSMNDPSAQVWTVNETGIQFDVANSVPRPDSLVNCFPVTPASLVVSPNLSPDADTPSGLSPEDMGFLSIAAPIDQVPMIPPWYGLSLSLDLGGLGALAGGAGLKAQILAAWSLGTTAANPPVYIGLKLPGTPTRGGSLPLQGVLKLGFKSFSFSTYMQGGQRAYLLKMSRFAMSVLGFTFPPGNLDISLFGGPQGRSTGQLGWLAAYVDPDADKDDARAPKTNRLSRQKRLGRIPKEP